MTLAEACILIACVMPIGCAALAKSKGFGTPRRQGGFDNHNPRQWLAGLEGWQARANAAQMNSFEALPVFIAGVLVAQGHSANATLVGALSVAFIGLRAAFVAAYITDRASLRSAFWTLALGCSIALFFVK